MKKLYIMVLIAVFIAGLGTVNDSYMELTGREDSFMPQIRRINEEHICLTLFGTEQYVNTAIIVARVNEVRYKVSDGTKGLIRKVETALGIEKEDPSREAYGVEAL